MNRIKKFFSDLRHSPSLPLYILAVVIVIAHLVLTKRFSDDIWFFSVLDGKDDLFGSLFDYLSTRYNSWTSRIPIELFLVLLVRVPLLWQIVDSVALIYIFFELSRLANPERSLTKNIIIALLLPVFPVWVLYEAGFVATSMNYIIPFACVMPTLSIIYRRSCSRKASRWEYAVALPLLVFGCFSEILCALLLIVSIGAIVLRLFERKGLIWVELAVLAISGALLLFHLTCPGNNVRLALETLAWLPEHDSLNLVEKAIVGFNAMTKTLFFSPTNIIVLVMCIALLLGTFLKCKSYILRGISVFVLAVTLIFGVLSPVLKLIAPFKALCGKIDGALKSTKMCTGSALMLIFAVFLLASMLVCLYHIISDKRQYFMLFFFLGTGAVCKISLGLSPTVWVSGARGATYLYIAIAITIGALAYEITNHFLSVNRNDKSAL